ncbi:MAG: hypothetical protein IKM99_09645 [Bacteroidales bacterium]|nr:hypothetical protein [Bacteroidales bacterium]
MKNKLFTITALCLSAVVLAACSKDKTPTSQSNASHDGHIQDPIEQLRTFKKQIESVKANPTAKSDETISLTEALWDVENTFNLTYSESEQYYSQINDHEFTLTLPVNEERNVLVYDAVGLYSNVILQAREAFAEVTFADKGFVSLTVKEVIEDEHAVSVKFSGKTGERCNYNLPSNQADGPFGEDDNWMFAAPLGKCDDPDIPSGADEQIQEQLYIKLIEPYMETDPAYRNIYIERKRFIFDGTNYPFIFYSPSPGNMCIDYINMNYYYNSEKHLITNIIPDQYHLTGYSPISIEIEGRVLPELEALTHYNEVEYGKRVRISTDEFGKTLDLMTE